MICNENIIEVDLISIWSRQTIRLLHGSVCEDTVLTVSDRHAAKARCGDSIRIGLATQAVQLFDESGMRL